MSGEIIGRKPEASKPTLGQKPPNPGSAAAQKRGCTCPVLDNGQGDEELGRIRGFWINSECPLHGVDKSEGE
jgi:hypothetical protein